MVFISKRKTYFSDLISRFKENSFVKSVLTLSLGVVISQSISLLTTPILSRIYNPEIFGDFALISSNANIIGVLVCLGMLSAIMIPKEDDEAKGICRLVIKAIVLVSTSLLLLAIALSPFYQFFTVSINYSIACVLIWACVNLTNISAVLYGYVNRQRLYNVLLWNPAIGTSAKAIICIGLGLISPNLLFYALGTIISTFLVIVHMLRYANPLKGLLLSEYSSKVVLKKYVDFPKYQLPANLLSIVSQQLPVQLIKVFFGSIVLGSYSMCMTILGIPSNFLATPVNRVYYQEATARYNAGLDIGEFSYKILEKNIKIAIIPIMLLTIFGEWIFVFVLGSKWELAGSFASILGVYQLVLFCSMCLSGNYVIIGKQHLNLIFAIIFIILNVLAFVLGYYVFGNIYSVLIFFAIAGTVYSLFDIGLFLYYTGVRMPRFIKFILYYIISPTAFSVLVRMLIKVL